LLPSISLKAYAVRIHHRGKPKQLAFFNDVVFETLERAIQAVKKPLGASGAEIDRVFSVQAPTLRTVAGPDRSISGQMRGGTSGFTSDIIAPQGALAFQRKTTDTEVIPYYFFASVPAANRPPIICIQQTSGNGLYLFFKSIFMSRLASKIDRENFVVRLNPIFLSGLYVSQFYKDGVVKNISAVAHRLSSDIADDAREARVRSEISLSPMRKKDAVATVKELLTGPNGKVTTDRTVVFRKIKEIFELEDEMDNIQELTIEAELGGVRRRISIGDNFGTAFDITNDVVRDTSGHPDPDSMHDYIKKFIEKSIRPYYGSGE
jgi:hypothetical protein